MVRSALRGLAERVRRQPACLWALLIVALFISNSIQKAHGEEIVFKSYSQADGLTNLGARCLRQDLVGYMYACTEHGLYVYDGRRFVNLGPQQGLPQGGSVVEVVITPDGYVIVRYSDGIFVSRSRIGRAMPPQTMVFSPAKSDVGLFFNDRIGQIAPWGDGAIVINDGRLDFVQIGHSGEPALVRHLAQRLRQSSGQIKNASLIFSDGNALWVALHDGRICQLNDGSEHCYGQADGLPDESWRTLLATRDGRLVTRSHDVLATIDPSHDRVEVETLPYQGERYINYADLLTLAEAPSGQLMTQADDGLIIKGHSGWKLITEANGLPSGPISSILFDHEKSLWLGVLGKGVVRALGYGLWENRNRQDGLPDDIVWQIVRESHGPLWVATDGGLDAIDVPQGQVIPRRHYNGPSFTLALGAPGHLWRSTAPSGVSCINTADGVVNDFPLPAVNQIVRGVGNRLWFATQAGLYFVDDVEGIPPTPRHADGPTGPLRSAAAAPDGGLWLISEKALLRRHYDGTMETVFKDWGQAEFTPFTIAVASPETIWVGGSGALLYRLLIEHDRVARIVRFGPPDILSTTVYSLLVDRRGWLWAGTDSGISVYDGKRWVSANTDAGLIWNDLNQDGLYEDQDGSMWISTSQGLSHLLDPLRLFERQNLQPVITSVTVGDRPFAEKALPYMRGALDINFGTLNFQAESAVRFRYRLEGFDTAWADTNAGSARYPYLPSGDHRFTIMAYDELTHQESAPVAITLRMRAPWWRWWPLEALYLVTAAALVYAAWRVRFNYLLHQRRILQHTVEMRTMEINAAHEALLLQASKDSLTGLLTRGEIQKRLVETLDKSQRPAHLSIGLFDIDHFKRINDRFGHLAGDEILREIGQRLNLSMRPNEHAGRYGGEEILIVVAGDRLDGLARIHELNIAISGRPFLVEDEVIHVTCSTGVARANLQDSWKSLIGRADRALYLAKEAGRDRVVEAPGDQIASRNAS